MRTLLLLAVLFPALAHAAGAKPEDTVVALWQALSHEPGVAADTATLNRLFHPDAVVIGGRYQKGEPVLSVTRAADFIGTLSRARPAGFHECEVARDLKQYDRFATAYSVVESRTDRSSARADFVGVNSIQLYKLGNDWKIVSLYYHVEKPGMAVPLEGGKPGLCLAR